MLTGGYIRQYIISVISVSVTATESIHSFSMQDHIHRGALLAWCLVFLVIVQQVTCSPLPQLDTPSSVQKVQRSLKRTARMTPLWRIMGTKPHGAYCQNNYECSTGICRRGHCSYSQPINS